MTASRTICLGFLTLIMIGTILLLLPWSVATGTWNSPLTALFTSTSAVCVTGLIVVDTGSYYSGFGEFVILTLIQVGGLGYMTATTFLLILLGRRFGLREKLALQQSLDIGGISGALQLVKSIMALTLIFEITGTFCLLPAFLEDYGNLYSIWLALFHSISAFNNAGFSLFADSLTGYATSVRINIVIPVLILLGGFGYQTIMEVYRWIGYQWRRRFPKQKQEGQKVRQREAMPSPRRSNQPLQRILFSLNFKIAVSTSFFLLLIGTILFLMTEYQNPAVLGDLSLGNKIMVSWFHAVMPRTAGFNSVDYGTLTTAGIMLTIALMYVGANPGGTGGGIKTTTLRILFSSTKAVLQGHEEVLCYQRQIPVTLIIKAVGVVFGSGVTILGVTLLLAVTNPTIDFIQLLFETVSAFATVGLSTGITASLSLPGKLLIIGTMYTGRVGVLLLMAALLGDPKPSVIRFPEENLLVG
ncbi:MAG: TrkH family potassium uptake protein [Leptolyngbyaceae bacterium]|nr:TrkH family potassium uptake protein [Leptolyngbyaceae bacterium]